MIVGALVMEAAKILGQYGTAVDVERVKMMQNAPRDEMGNILWLKKNKLNIY